MIPEVLRPIPNGLVQLSPESLPLYHNLEPFAQVVCQTFFPDGKILQEHLPEPLVAFTPEGRVYIEQKIAEPAYRGYQEWEAQGRREPLTVLNRGLNGAALIVVPDLKDPSTSRFLFIEKKYGGNRRAIDCMGGGSNRIHGD